MMGTMDDMPRSFSGAHPYRPKCVIDVIVDEWAEDGIDQSENAVRIAEQVTRDVDAGRCPRCKAEDALAINAGSRATPCRCIPICTRCGTDEFHQALLGTGLSQVWRWPVRKGDITKRANRAASKQRPKLVTLGTTEDGDIVLLDESGVSQVQPRPHAGGWSEFGYDDNEDRAEQRGR